MDNDNFTLLSAQTFASENTTETIKILDQYVGYAHKLPSSVNLFLNLSDVVDPKVPYIKFMTITLPGEGSKEHAITWGVYDKNTSKFIIDTGCNYQSYAKMNEIINNWRKEGYQSAMAVKENKISANFNKYFDSVSFVDNDLFKPKYITDDEVYRAVLYFIAYERGEISSEQLLQGAKNYYDHINNLAQKLMKGDIEDMSELKRMDFVEELQIQKKMYEDGLNVVSVLNTIEMVLGPYVHKITEQFKDTYAKSKFSFEANLQFCPNMNYCRDNPDEVLCGYVKYITESELLN